MSFTTRGNGKLILTGEYLVLKGAKALCLPTKLGQSFSVEYSTGDRLLLWKSFEIEHQWFEAQFQLPTLKVISSTDHSNAETLRQILELVPKEKFIPVDPQKKQLTITTQLEFPLHWGLGSSSTLIYCISRWAQIDPYLVLKKTFGGSGYDIACAEATSPIFFSIIKGKPQISKAFFNPPFKDYIFFVHLNKKQNSREAIRFFQNKPVDEKTLMSITEIGERMLSVKTLTEFEHLIDEHETILSTILNLPTIKQQIFSDYLGGEIKSLGAWGGDFILVTGEINHVFSYFQRKGFSTILSWNDLILERE